MGLCDVLLNRQGLCSILLYHGGLSSFLCKNGSLCGFLSSLCSFLKKQWRPCAASHEKWLQTDGELLQEVGV